MNSHVTSLIFLAALASSAFAQPGGSEDDYYRLLRFPMTEQVVLEAGAVVDVVGAVVVRRDHEVERLDP